MGVLSSPNASTSPAREGGPGRWQYYHLDDIKNLDDNFNTTFDVVPPVGGSTSCNRIRSCSPRTEAAPTWRSLSDARIWVDSQTLRSQLLHEFVVQNYLKPPDHQ